ncbi:STAS domain-containing protein [soil metagenome]
MADTTTAMSTRVISDDIMVIDIVGDVVPATEDMLLDAFGRCEGARAVILNFSDLAYMNSGGIGLLVTMLVRAQRDGQALYAYGLSDHYRHIFQLTRLDDTIGLHDSEADAVAAVDT